MCRCGVREQTPSESNTAAEALKGAPPPLRAEQAAEEFFLEADEQDEEFSCHSFPTFFSTPSLGYRTDIHFPFIF